MSEFDTLRKLLEGAGATRAAIQGIRRLAGDASTRVYYRTLCEDDSTAIVMVQPDPGQGQEETFLEVQRFLSQRGLPVPEVYFHDPPRSIVVLQDLGDDLLEAVVDRSDPDRVRGLYVHAVDILLNLRRRTAGLDSDCVAFSLAFDEEKLMQEFHFFVTHFVKGLCEMLPSPAAEATLEEFFLTVSRFLAAEPRIFAHRDFHARNLILHQGRLVMIDFQDARMGPAQYDLASLLRDSYITLPEDLVAELVNYYASETEESSQERFRYVFDVMSLQRNIKALGTFGYQLSVRGTNRYASSIPRTGAYVARNIAAYPEFAQFRPIVEDLISGPATSMKFATHA